MARTIVILLILLAKSATSPVQMGMTSATIMLTMMIVHPARARMIVIVATMTRTVTMLSILISVAPKVLHLSHLLKTVVVTKMVQISISQMRWCHHVVMLTIVVVE